MTEEMRGFPLRDILTVVTGRLLTEPDDDDDNGIIGMYKVLTWLCDEPVMSHQLGRFADECRPWLYRWFPDLAACGSRPAMDSLDGWLGRGRTADTQEGVRMWLAEMKMTIPGLADEYVLPRIPADDHERKDAYDELVVMRGTDEGIEIIEIPARDEAS